MMCVPAEVRIFNRRFARFRDSAVLLARYAHLRGWIALLQAAFATCGLSLFTPAYKALGDDHATPHSGEINRAMLGFVEAGEISGAVVLIARDGKIIHFGAVGAADIDQPRSMKPSSMFAIASMTKPIVATAALMLQDEGKLSVEDKVSQYLPKFASLTLNDGTPAARPITIRDCLTHTSGLTGAQTFVGTLKSGVDELATRPLAFQPGARWQYSPGLNIVGRIIEVVTKQPLQDFLEQRMFRPLHMESTTFFPGPEHAQRLAVLYGPNEDAELVPQPNQIKNATAPLPSGGLFSTAKDMFHFYQMVLDRGVFKGQRIVSEAAVAQMTSQQTGELKTGFTPGNCWGLGWCVVRHPQGVTESVSPGTFGHGGAFGTQGWVDPQTKMIYILMIQRTKLPNSDASDMRKAVHDLGTKFLKQPND